MKVHTYLISEVASKLLRDSAIDLAKRGYQVFPLHTTNDGNCTCSKAACPSPGKHPRIKAWKEKASSDPAIVDSFWAKFPDANIGIATGQKSGVVVLDIDGETGEATLKGLAEAHGGLAETLTAITGRGRHLYFKGPNTPIGNAVGKLGPGLDIRGKVATLSLRLPCIAVERPTAGWMPVPPRPRYPTGSYSC
jgi:hypothetical protein